MLKILLKKQFMSVFSGMGMKKGSKKAGTYVLILAFAALMGGVMVYSFASTISAGYASTDYAWAYFAIVGILGIIMSVVGGVFMTQSCLYEAKDNELLLSLPIRPAYILFVRMIPLYAQNLFFEAIVLVPSCICWCLATTVSISQVIIWIISLLVQPFLSLFITCLLGLLIALASARMRDKTLMTVIVSFIFIAVYLVFYAFVLTDVDALINNGASIAAKLKKFYPFYAFGIACMGDWVGIIITDLIVLGLFGALYFVLSRTYIKMVTAKHGGSKAVYKGRAERPASVMGALVKKEVRRFFGSGIYFLNSGFGVILLILATIVFLIYGKSVISSLDNPDMLKALPLLIVLAVAFICSMNGVSAPSVSLEGKMLWILHSTPVTMWQVLKAKLVLHYLVTAPAATVCTAIMAIVIKPSWEMVILMLLAPSVVVTLFGAIGLIFNLKKPKLDWENETIVIKQSMSVMLTMLTGWGIFGIMAALYIAARLVMSDAIYLLVCLVLLCAATAGLMVYLNKKGAKILQDL